MFTTNRSIAFGTFAAFVGASLLSGCQSAASVASKPASSAVAVHSAPTALTREQADDAIKQIHDHAAMPDKQKQAAIAAIEKQVSPVSP